jgi:putative transposase
MPKSDSNPMPRPNRHFLPGYVWHIIHRCHGKSFLLKFARDRHSYLRWLFEAKKRFGLSVLDYIVTCNHVHLLTPKVIANSMQLIAGRSGQEYNQRKGRHGAFWEDRYHATAIEANEHLQRCLVYIDLNMVRARVVRHPHDWTHSGYREIQNPPKRYGIIDLRELSSLCGFREIAEFPQAHRRSRCRGIRTRELPNSFLERFELSAAIERLERFEPTVAGPKRSQWAS